MRTAIYARISKDDGEALGVGRQVDDCEKLAAQKDWSVTERYIDNNVSASKNRPRPAYERMIADVEAGALDAVVVWDIDRLTRKPMELETFIELADRHHLSLASVGGEIDLSSPQGRLTARIKGGVARHEAEQMGRRIRRKQEENARTGRSYHGQTPFGYDRATVTRDGHERRMLVPHPVEGPLVQEAYRRLLDGDSLWGITRDWKVRGIVGKRGNSIRGNVLGNMLRRPVYAGKRSWNGEIVGDGEWDALVSWDDYSRAGAILNAPGRFHLHGTAPKYLLSGIARCGACGEKMRPKVQKGRVPSLVCYECQKVTRSMKPLDEYVTEVIVERLRGMELDLSDPEDGTAHAEAIAARDAIVTRMDELADAMASGEIAVRVASRSSARLEADLAAAEERVLATAPNPTLAAATGASAAEAWEASPLEQKRQIIRDLAHITVMPSGPGIRFHPDQVVIEWLA